MQKKLETITVYYENPDTHEEYKQDIVLDEYDADDIYIQMLDYDGGEIPKDSPLFYLFTAIKYISKLQGFSKTPNFNIVPPEDIQKYAEIKYGERN